MTEPRDVIHFDGACWPNPGGTATFAWEYLHDGVKLAGEAGVAEVGDGATNNVGEYRGLIGGLEYLNRLVGPPAEVRIRGDSKLVVYQVAGGWACRAGHLIELRDRCRELIDVLGARGCAVTLEWVPRDQNAGADEGARLAWEGATGKLFPDLGAMKARRGH